MTRSVDALTGPLVASTLFSGVVLTTAVAVGLWVSRDARARGSSVPYLLGLAAVLGPGLPLYLLLWVTRTGVDDRDAPPGEFDRALATWAGAGVLAFLAGTLLAPPDPVSVAVRGLVAFLLTLPVAYALVFRRGYRRLAGALRG